MEMRISPEACFPLPKEYLTPTFPRARASVLNSKPVYKKDDGYIMSTFRVIFQILHFSFQILSPGNTDPDCCKSQLATQLFVNLYAKGCWGTWFNTVIFFFKSICWWREDKICLICRMFLETEMCGEVCSVSNLLQLNFVFRGWFNSLQNLLHTEYNTNKVRN